MLAYILRFGVRAGDDLSISCPACRTTSGPGCLQSHSNDLLKQSPCTIVKEAQKIILKNPQKTNLGIAILENVTCRQNTGSRSQKSMFKCGDSSKYIIVLSDHFIVSFGLCKILFKKSLIKQCCDFVGILIQFLIKAILQVNHQHLFFFKIYSSIKKTKYWTLLKTVSTELNKKILKYWKKK